MLVLRFLTGDQEAYRQLQDQMTKSFYNSLAECATVIETAGVSEIVNSFLDILAGINWVVEDMMFTALHSVITYSHYATLQLGSAPVSITGYSYTSSGALEAGKQNTLWFEVSAIARILSGSMPPPSAAPCRASWSG